MKISLHSHSFVLSHRGNQCQLGNTAEKLHQAQRRASVAHLISARCPFPSVFSIAPATVVGQPFFLPCRNSRPNTSTRLLPFLYFTSQPLPSPSVSLLPAASHPYLQPAGRRRSIVPPPTSGCLVSPYQCGVMHEAVFLVLHRCSISLDEQRHFCGRIPNSSLQHLLLLWLSADLPQLTICVLALSASTPSLFNSSFNPTPLVVRKTAHTSTSLHLSTSASRPTS
ncbi:hypothetical protein BHE74_00044788 [Ensete ventricosum]|nr:hypothetical protein BHE74_00044788 [Ensete ventricosum]